MERRHVPCFDVFTMRRPLCLVSLLTLAACSESAANSAGGSSTPQPGPAIVDGGTDPADSATPPPPPGPTATYFPPAGDTWETVDAAAAGFDPAKLAELTTFVEQSASNTFVILFDGRIVVEKYWSGSTATSTRDIASAQKSVSSLLVGAAVAQNAFGLDDTVTSALGDGWSNGSVADEAGITVRHLLTMTSGLDTNLQHDAAPGTKWLYNTDAYHRLELVIETKTGKTLQEFTRAALFDPIGVGPSAWAKRQFQKDAKGVPISALEMTARDMARVGLLVMANGVWSGKAVVPSSYLTTALAPSQALNPSYGFLFWLNGQSTLLKSGSLSTDMLMPHGPTDIVAALGAGDQKIHVSRSTKLVVTRQGASAGEPGAAATAWDDEIWTRIMAARTAK